MAPPPPPPLSALSPDFINAYNGDPLRKVAIAFTVLEVAFVALRYLSKLVGRNPFGPDDWILVPSLVFCIGLNTSALIALDIAGLGHHTVVLEDTDPEKVTQWQKMLIATPILYSFAICLSKLSILVFYVRIFVTKFQRIATFTIMGIVVATAIADIIATGFQCIPLEKFWNRKLPGHCFNYNMFYRYGSLPNPITDLLMLLLPIPVVWSLRSNIKVKIGLTFTFLTGSIGLIAAILRTYAFFRHNALGDATWGGGFLYIWIVVEPGCYLIAACLICLRPLLNFITGKGIDNSGKRSSVFSRSRRALSMGRRPSAHSGHRSASHIRRDLEIRVVHTQSAPSMLHEKDDEVMLVDMSGRHKVMAE